jgi:outer membrane protein W
MKKARLLIALLILVSGLSFAQPKRFELSLFGGVNPIFAYGSPDDYVAGSNDFPVTPAHTPGSFGAALTYYLSDRLGVELRGEYTLAAPLTLTDPSDQDTASIKSGEHIAASLNLLWEPLGGRIRPYLVLGGGADKFSANVVTVISQNGYEVTFAPPDKTVDFFANAGGGLRLQVSSSFGFNIDLRYRLLFAAPDVIQGLVAAGGFSLRF